MPGLQNRRSLTKQIQLPLKGYVDCSSTVERLIVAQETRVRLPPAQLRAACCAQAPGGEQAATPSVTSCGHSSVG